MDRFIDWKSMSVSIISSNLKSNMDRFIDWYCILKITILGTFKIQYG